MYKWIMSTLLIIASVFGVYLLAQGMPQKPQEEVLPEGQELLKITATNFEFNEKEYHVKAGTTYTIKFANDLGTHGAEIKDLGINLTKENPSVEYTFDKPGTYEIICSVMCGTGHAAMKSVIIVS